MTSTPRTTAFSRHKGEGAEDERPTILERIRRRFGQMENPLAPKPRFEPGLLAEGIFPLTREVATQPITSRKERLALWEALYGRIEKISSDCGNPYFKQLELVAEYPAPSRESYITGNLLMPHRSADPLTIFTLGQRSKYVN